MLPCVVSIVSDLGFKAFEDLIVGMSHRLSRAEKGKAVVESTLQRKPLVKVPDSDISELIEQNKFTLIGRVTNPTIQKTRALVEFFLQHWSVVGRLTGRALGPSLFQFGFESEKDLQSILSKAPFHYKKWMIILQRWEPIVSDAFPNQIPFWVNIHGIPLHYWNEQTIDAIGPVLGHIEIKEASKARLRVSVNGLEPLIMKMDLQLPSGEVVEIEMEYEYLQKHCFYCKALSHEEDACQLRLELNHQKKDRRSLGISQQNTLENIEERRRRQDDRKRSRQITPANEGGARWTNYKRDDRGEEYDRRAYHQKSHYQRYSPPSRRRESERNSASGFEENKRRYDDRCMPLRNAGPIERRQSNRDIVDGNSSTFKTQERAEPPPHAYRELRDSAVREVSSKSNQSPSTAPRSNDKRTASSRLSEPNSGIERGENRVSAKGRLSVNTQRLSRSAGERVNGESELPVNPQSVVALQQVEKTLPPHRLESITRPSSSNIFETGRLGPCERSPIRTLSEDRIHVSLRLGPLLSDTTEETEDSRDLPLHPELSAKAAGKRVVKKRSIRSPLNVGKPKKKRSTATTQSPRRKLMLDAITAGGRAPRKVTSKKPSTKPFPARAKKGLDFLPPQMSLP